MGIFNAESRSSTVDASRALCSHAPTMKFLFPVIAIALLSACSPDLYRHERDFSTKQRKGSWYDYHQAVRNGEQPEAPKELKDR